MQTPLQWDNTCNLTIVFLLNITVFHKILKVKYKFQYLKNEIQFTIF